MSETIEESPAQLAHQAESSSNAGAALAQPAREQNIQAFVDYVRGGIKPAGEPEALGIELEHTIVYRASDPVSYTQENGIAWLLEQLREDYPDATYDSDGDLLGLARPGESITLEPAAQVELSAGPFTSLEDAQHTFQSFESLVQSKLRRLGMKPLYQGYHPKAKAADLELIPKPRYRYMDRYFQNISPYGVCMMRGSASTQISIDYHSEQDCLRKLRLAGIASPLFALMCDNSPLFEGATRPHKMMRTKIWKECDSARCGIVPGSLDPDFTLEQYVNYLLDTPAILVPDGSGGFREANDTFGDIYRNNPMTRAEVEHMVSMFFTDVRVKTYVEIRPADALPIPYVMAYAALIKGLLTTNKGLDALDELFEGVTEADVVAAKDDLMARGYQAKVYGRDAAQLCDKLHEVAAECLDEGERHYLKLLTQLVRLRRTLADLTQADLSPDTQRTVSLD